MSLSHLGAHHIQQSYENIQNPNNVFNVFGEIHNNALDCCWERADAENPDTISDYYPYVIDYLKLTPLEGDSTWADNMTYEQFISLDSVEYYWTYVVSSCSGTVATYLENILTVVQDTTHELDYIIPTLSDIETSIISDSLGWYDRSMPLLAIAIAKHSAAYWTDTNNVNKWNEIGQGFEKRATYEDEPKKKSKVRKVVVSDLKGAVWGAVSGWIGGAITGAIFGSSEGPAGTVAGAAGGAIQGSLIGAPVGCIMSSVQQALEHP